MSLKRKVTERGWPDWYANPDPLKVSFRLIGSLSKSLAIAAVIVWVSILFVAKSSDAEVLGNPIEDDYAFNDYDRVWLFGVSGVLGSFFLLGVSSLIVVLFDQSFGKEMSPSTAAASINAIALIPSWAAGVYLLELAGEPVNHKVAAVWFVGIMVFGAAAGCWASIEQIQIVKAFSRWSPWHRITLRQLIVALIWLAVLLAFAAGHSNVLVYSCLFLITLVVVLFAFNR